MSLTIDDRLLVTVAEAARLLSVSEKQVYRLAADGSIEKRYVGEGTRSFRIPLDSLRDYVDGLPTDPVVRSS